MVVLHMVMDITTRWVFFLDLASFTKAFGFGIPVDHAGTIEVVSSSVAGSDVHGGLRKRVKRADLGLALPCTLLSPCCVSTGYSSARS
jgi:hypothetical protein